MTRRHRPSPPSPEFSISSSAAATSKPRRRFPREKTEYDDDYADASGSQSLYYESQGEEYEHFENDEDNGSAYIGSESVSNDDPASSQRPKLVRETETNKMEGKSYSMAASNSPNLSNPITQTASYIKIAPLPIFRATPRECPIAHLSRFNKVCRANNASSIEVLMRIFPVTLEDEAALWYDLNIDPYPSLSWDDIKSSFLQAYHKMELIDELRSELMTMNQEAKESVRSYFLRLQWILERWPEHGLTDALLKGVFIDGLRVEFHDWILLQKPNSLNDALKLAFGFEQLRSIRDGKQKVPTCGFCEGMHEERDCEVREAMKDLWTHSKEKQRTASLAISRSDKAAKDFERSISMGSSSAQTKIERNEKKKSGETNMKKNQCQCLKHECANKKLMRNSSLVSKMSCRE